MEVRRSDGAGVAEGGEEEDDNPSSHGRNRGENMPRGEARIRYVGEAMIEVEGEAARHHREIEELEQRVWPPAAHVINIVDRAHAPLAAAPAEAAAQADAACEVVVQSADEAGGARAETTHIHEKRAEQDQQQREPHGERGRSVNYRYPYSYRWYR